MIFSRKQRRLYSGAINYLLDSERAWTRQINLCFSLRLGNTSSRVRAEITTNGLKYTFPSVHGAFMGKSKMGWKKDVCEEVRGTFSAPRGDDGMYLLFLGVSNAGVYKLNSLWFAERTGITLFTMLP